MNVFYEDRYRPITTEVYLINRPLAESVSAFFAWMGDWPTPGQAVQESLPAGPLCEALDRLGPLVKGPPNRTLFVEVSSDWTAGFNNFILGTDGSSVPSVLAERMGCRAIRASYQPYVHRGELHRDGVRLVSVFDGQMLENRSIFVGSNGTNWEFEAHGPPLPEEDPSWYEPRRRSLRFKYEDFRELLDRLVPGVWSLDARAHVSSVLVQRLNGPVLEEVSLLESQRGIPQVRGISGGSA